MKEVIDKTKKHQIGMSHYISESGQIADEIFVRFSEELNFVPRYKKDLDECIDIYKFALNGLKDGLILPEVEIQADIGTEQNCLKIGNAMVEFSNRLLIKYYMIGLIMGRHIKKTMINPEIVEESAFISPRKK